LVLLRVKAAARFLVEKVHKDVPTAFGNGPRQRCTLSFRLPQ
jgi:hypothetical protein